MEKVRISQQNPEAYVNAILKKNNPPNKSISGLIYLENGCPLNNACVKVTDRHYNPLEHTISNFQGEYNLTYPENGYYCIFAKENYVTQILELSKIPEIIVLKGENIVSIVTGTVVINHKQAPIPLALVEIKSENFSKTTSTNEKGEFLFSYVPTGNYSLIIKGNNIVTYNYKFFIPHAIKIIPIGTLYVEFLPIHGTLNGVITDENGVPLVGVTVILYKENNPISSTKTIENGIYFFGNLLEGTYYIQAFD